jgi:hypothetical protein
MRHPTARAMRATLVGALLLSGAACSNALQGVSGRRAHVERLYLGRNKGNVEVVTDSAWAAFLRDVVTPAFPKGLTVWEASGQWQDTTGVLGPKRSL